METVFIDDGFTLTHNMPATPGFHPPAEIVYRPALAKERHAYSAKLETKNAEAIDQFEVELIARHLVSVNGDELKDAKDKNGGKDKEKIRRIFPHVRNRMVDLILSYTPAVFAEVEGKSSGVSG